VRWVRTSVLTNARRSKGGEERRARPSTWRGKRTTLLRPVPIGSGVPIADDHPAR
jgi:hypothetical protein